MLVKPVRVALTLLLFLGSGAIALPNGDMLLTLEHATIPQRANDEMGYLLVYNAAMEKEAHGKLELLLRVRDGRLEPVCSGMSTTYNLALHFGRAKESAAGEQSRIAVDLEISPDKLAPAAKAQYEITLNRSGEEPGGTFTGSFNGTAVRGAVRGMRRPAYPLAQAHAPLSTGEHPRLIFRRSELETIRTRAGTKDGQEIIAKLRQWLERGKSNRFGIGEGVAPPYTEASFATGHALLWPIGQDRAEADRAKELTQLAMRFSGGEWGGWARAFLTVGIAHAYDLCYDAWDAPFRREVADFLAERIAVKRRSVDAAWEVMFNAAAGMAALAILGDPEDANGVAAAGLREIEHFLYWHQRLALGEKGFSTESINQTEALHNLLPLLHALRTARGQDFVSGTGFGWIVPNAFMSRGRFFGNAFGDDYWSVMAFPGLLPQEWQPALKHQMRQPMKGRTPLKDAMYGMTLPHHAAYALVSYPFDIDATSPVEMELPLAMEDAKFGGYIFRSGWSENDIVVTFRAQSNAPRASVHAGAFTVSGLGVKSNIVGGEKPEGGLFTLATLNNLSDRPNVPRVENALPMRGGRVTYSKLEPDGSGVVTEILDLWVEGHPWGFTKPWAVAKDEKSVLGLMSGRHGVKADADLGVKATRSFAVDFSGKCGAPCLIAVVDRFEGAEKREKYVQYSLAHRGSFSMALGAKGFLMGHSPRSGDAMPQLLSATWVWPEKVSLSSGADVNMPHQVQARGGNEYFVVMTVQKGAVPEVRVSGTGAETRVKVGGQSVRFDGQKIVLGED